MFRTYQVFWNRLFQILDATIVIVSFLLAWSVKFHSGWLAYGGHLPLRFYFPAMIFAVPLFLFSNWMTGLYRPMRSRSFWQETSAIFRSVTIGLLMFMSFLYFTQLADFSRTVLFLFSITFIALTYIERLGIRALLRWVRAHGLNKKFVVIVGWTPAVERFVRNLENQPWFGYHVLGYLSDGEEFQPRRDAIPPLGKVSELKKVLHNHLVDHVLVSLPRLDSALMSKVLASCESMGVQSLIVPDYYDALPAKPRFETVAGMPVIDTRYVPLDDAVNAFLKRTFDIVFSSLVLFVLSPVFLIIGLVIKLSSNGPVFHVQERVGRNRRIFNMYKFRTMRIQQPNEEEVVWTQPNDPRRTKVGIFLRRTSLDELPQFWNVLIGDMSVIGPRPERPFFVERFREDIPRYMVKHRVRPGITGWAQVNGWRGDTSIKERIRYDIDYIENWSFGMDLKIVWKTLKDGFLHKNAY